MIVFLTRDGYDGSVAVQAQPMDNGFIKIDGDQLYVVAEGNQRPYINKDAVYYVYRTDYKVKCYDCFQFSGTGKSFEPSVNTRYIMRCQAYHPRTGSPGFTIEEAVKAGVPEHKALLYVNPETGLLHIKPSMLVAA